ncbi:NAD-dependent epimerase/dehydratase family protein [Sphingomonas soli]|uniref:NAD-dependent epimerase/dehydratase family protein n=1 Tax=Sphingomonas soli TaxID=266127 RepID=UPI00082ADF53|nr:NAD-dependent epimerase/dehydratase family protein [Sphingomonas soli]
MKGVAIIAGGEGLLGRSLQSRLARFADLTVISVGRSAGDLRDFASWEGLPRADYVFQLAARTFVPESWETPYRFVQDNLEITAAAVEYCRLHKAKIIYASSYLYGNPETLPIAETARVDISNPYGLSKRMCEEMVEHFSHMFGFPAAIVRPFNIYGPNQDARFLLPSIVHQAKHSEAIQVQDLEPKRDYVFVEDVAEAFIASALHDSPFAVFNVGSGESYSVGEVADIVKALVGRDVPVVSTGIRRVSEIMDTRADISKANELLNWSPRVTIQEGLKLLVESTA